LQDQEELDKEVLLFRIYHKSWKEHLHNHL